MLSIAYRPTNQLSSFPCMQTGTTVANWKTYSPDSVFETLVWCFDTLDAVAKHQPRSRDIRNTKNVLSEH